MFSDFMIVIFYVIFYVSVKVSAQVQSKISVEILCQLLMSIGYGQVGGPQQILELFLNKSFRHVIYPIHSWCSMVCHKKSLKSKPIDSEETVPLLQAVQELYSY